MEKLIWAGFICLAFVFSDTDRDRSFSSTHCSTRSEWGRWKKRHENWSWGCLWESSSVWCWLWLLLSASSVAVGICYCWRTIRGGHPPFPSARMVSMLWYSQTPLLVKNHRLSLTQIARLCGWMARARRILHLCFLEYPSTHTGTFIFQSICYRLGSSTNLNVMPCRSVDWFTEHHLQVNILNVWMLLSSEYGIWSCSYMQCVQRCSACVSQYLDWKFHLFLENSLILKALLLHNKHGYIEHLEFRHWNFSAN